jgi:hypothetical protein
MVDAKACKKEGGKKGVDVVGMSDLGGVKYFNVTIDGAEGSLEGLSFVLEGMNAEVDESAEERKGGAGALGKMLYSAADPGSTVALLCNIPKAVTGDVTMAEWMDAVIAVIGGTVASREETEDTIKVLITADSSKDEFPLKMRDAAQAEGFAFLRRKGCLPAGDDSDDDYIPDLEAEGIEW